MSPVTEEGVESRQPDSRAGMRDGGGRPGRRRRRRGGGGGGEQPTVPEAEFRTYYGVPVVKAPVWKHDIPAYLFTGGVAAGSSLLALGGDLTGRPALRTSGRVASLGALLASTYFLINDLGKPSRFHHMLRVAKPTSPMSMGTWILAAYGPTAGLAAMSEAAPLLPPRGALGLARRMLPPAGRAAGVVSALFAPALASYTAVLIADTAVPSWHEAYRELPFVFVGSALASGAGVGLLAAPPAQTRPARGMAVAGAALELLAERRITTGMGLLSEPYEHGHPARLLRASQVLTLAGTAGALLGRRSRLVAGLSGLALLAGSAATRFGIYDGGVESAKDPKYTVIPQRERLSRAQGERGAGSDPRMDHAPQSSSAVR